MRITVRLALPLVVILASGCGIAGGDPPHAGARATTATYTLTAGVDGGVHWRYVAFGTEDGYCDQFVIERSDEVVVDGSDESFSPACRAIDHEGDGASMRLESRSGLPTFVSGGVTSNAEHIVVETRFDGPYEVEAIQPPDKLRLGFDLFVAAIAEADPVIRVVAYDAEGGVVAEYETGLTP